MVDCPALIDLGEVLERYNDCFVRFGSLCAFEGDQIKMDDIEESDQSPAILS